MIISGKLYSFPWNYDMWVQPSIKPYQKPLIYPGNSVTTDGEQSQPELRETKEEITKNPIPYSKQSAARGEELYAIYCAVCHGPEGKGDGIIIKKGLGFYPVNLGAPVTAARTDGYLYAYIRYGGKVMMPSYRESISAEDAWHTVNYLRKLQKQQAAAAGK